MPKRRKPNLFPGEAQWGASDPFPRLSPWTTFTGLKPAKKKKATNTAGATMLPNLPDLSTFFPQTMDVYTGAQNDTVPPAAGNRRLTSISILVTGTFLEGTRSRTIQGFAYTHVILCDPNVEIRDYYSGDNVTPSTASAPYADLLSIPGGTTAGGSGNNYWLAVFSFVTVIPGLGRRKVILADRHSTIGNWPGLV